MQGGAQQGNAMHASCSKCRWRTGGELLLNFISILFADPLLDISWQLLHLQCEDLAGSSVQRNE